MNRFQLPGLAHSYLLRRRLRALGIPLPAFARGRHWWQPWRAPTRSWRLTILAEIDEERRLVSPTALIAGTPVKQGRVVFELRNEMGPIGSPVERRLTIEESSSSTLTLPDIPLPEGATGAITSWCWNVQLESKHGRTLALWSKRLASAGALNCEAEIDL